MRTFLPLLRRELREIRTLFVLGVPAAVVASIAFRHFLMGWSPGGGETPAVVVMLILVAVLSAASASDAVAGDVLTRRIETFAALPVPLSELWRAKATAVGIASLLAAALVVGANWAIVAVGVGPADAARFLDTLAWCAPWLVASAALGSATLFVSTVVERGFAAFLGAIVALVGLAVLVETAELPCASFVESAVLRIVLMAFAATAFLVASRFAFVRGELHVGKKAKPALVAVGAAAAFFVPAAVALPAWAHAGDVESLDGFADGRVVKSPSGKWTAGEATKGDRRVVWIADEGGRRRVVATNAELGWRDTWTPESNLRLWTATFTWAGWGLMGEGRQVEPSHLDVVERSRMLADRPDRRGR